MPKALDATAILSEILIMAEQQISEEQLKTLHPLAADVVAAFDEAGSKPQFALNNAQLGELREALSGLYETESLRDAVRSLLGIAHGFEQQGVITAATQLFELLREKPLLDALDEVNAAREQSSRDAVADSSKKFDDFQDKADGPAAPKVGDERPEGTLSIDKLSFPKRL
ncbi:MAG: hypothetical protein AAFN74_21435 [Myxococcota bacterium]